VICEMWLLNHSTAANIVAIFVAETEIV